MLDIRETIDRGDSPTGKQLDQLIDDGISIITIAETFNMTVEMIEELILESD